MTRFNTARPGPRKCRFGSGAGIVREQFMVIPFRSSADKMSTNRELDKLFHIFHHSISMGLLEGTSSRPSLPSAWIHCIPIVILKSLSVLPIQIKIET